MKILERKMCNENIRTYVENKRSFTSHQITKISKTAFIINIIIIIVMIVIIIVVVVVIIIVVVVVVVIIIIIIIIAFDPHWNIGQPPTQMVPRLQSVVGGVLVHVLIDPRLQSVVGGVLVHVLIDPRLQSVVGGVLVDVLSDPRLQSVVGGVLIHVLIDPRLQSVVGGVLIHVLIVPRCNPFSLYWPPVCGARCAGQVQSPVLLKHKQASQYDHSHRRLSRVRLICQQVEFSVPCCEVGKTESRKSVGKRLSVVEVIPINVFISPEVKDKDYMLSGDEVQTDISRGWRN